MNSAQQVFSTVTSAVSVSKEPERLSDICEPGCAATIWNRTPLPNFQSWIDGLNPDQLPSARVILPRENAQETVHQICNACGTPASEERQMLIGDVAALVDIFADFMLTSHVQLRFDVVDSNACRKFHIDAVKARLVCTYRGTGTQYGFASDGVHPDRVFTVPTGAPMLMRGTLWPETPKSGLLHRSPPIEGTGETRLLMVLDPIDQPDVRLDQRKLN